MSKEGLKCRLRSVNVNRELSHTGCVCTCWKGSALVHSYKNLTPFVFFLIDLVHFWRLKVWQNSIACACLSLTNDKRKVFKVASVSAEPQVHLEQLPFCVSDIQNCSAFSTQQLSEHICVCTEGERMECWNRKLKIHPFSYSLSGSWRQVGVIECTAMQVPMQVQAFITTEETNVFRRLTSAGEEISSLVSAEQLHGNRYLKMWNKGQLATWEECDL